MTNKFNGVRGSIVSMAMVFSACQAETLAQDTPQTPPATAQASCQQDEYRQMDFWVGDWDLTWANADGTEGQGTNIITKDAFGDCVVTENFDGALGNNLVGISLSTYSVPHGLWRQTWVDNQGGFYALSGGPQEDGTFILNMTRLNDKGPYSRMVFEDIKTDSLVWRWQGKQADTDNWADAWVINYKRK